MSASGPGELTSGDDAEIRRLSTWSGFVGPLDQIPVSDIGRRIVGEAVDIVREFFTDDWLAVAVAARSMPMVNLFEWPLTVPRCVVGFLELAARIAILEPTGVVPLIRRQLRPSDRAGEFEHLRLLLEVAGLAHRAGWSIEVERTIPSGSRPDLTLTRDGETVQVEVTNQGHSRRVRAVVEFGRDVRYRCWAVEVAHKVRCVVTSQELVTTDDLDEWFRLADEAELVSFTGNGDITIDLDDYDPLGTWAGKAWRALLALSGYARSKATGQFDGGIDSYLKNTPVGRPGFSAQRHARDESEPVKASPVFRRARVFPVPTVISTAREVFMPAHFKIAQFGLISPRLHYQDATGVDGRIYVGYLGPHLPTKDTN